MFVMCSTCTTGITIGKPNFTLNVGILTVEKNNAEKTSGQRHNSKVYYTEITPTGEESHRGLSVDTSCCLNQNIHSEVGRKMYRMVKAFFCSCKLT